VKEEIKIAFINLFTAKISSEAWEVGEKLSFTTDLQAIKFLPAKV